MRGGGGARGSDEDAAAATAAAASTPGFLIDGRPDLSEYLSAPGTLPAASAAASAGAASHASAGASTAAAAPPAPAGPVYCERFMQNLCSLRSCDDKAETDSEDDGGGDAPGEQGAAGTGRRTVRRSHRCEFVHDAEFRRGFLARTQYKLTNASRNPHAGHHGNRGRPHATPVPLDADGKPRDGKLAGLKAPSKEDALLRKLLANELRTESSRVLQAVRWIVSKQFLQAQRDVRTQQQREAERLYRESKAAEQAAPDQHNGKQCED